MPFVPCPSAGMTSESIWTSRRSWQHLANSSNEDDSMCGNSSREQDFSSPIQRHKHFMWTSLVESSRSLRSSVLSLIFSKTLAKNHFSHSLFFLQLCTMLFLWRYSSRRKIWSSILLWCSSRWVLSLLFFHSGSANIATRKRGVFSFSQAFSWDLLSVWRWRRSCSFLDDLDSFPIDTSHSLDFSDISLFLLPYLLSSISGYDSMWPFQVIQCLWKLSR